MYKRPAQRGLRGFVNAQEPDAFWLASDAVALEEDANALNQDDDEGTWKNHLAWTVKTSLLREGSSSSTMGRDLWRKGHLRILVSAPRTSGGRSRILFDPPVDENDAGDVTMLVLDFVGVALWQYACLKNRESGVVTGPLAAVLEWASPPGIIEGTNANLFQGTFPDTHEEILAALPEALRERLDQEQLQAIQRISSSKAPIQFIHALAGAGKTQVLKCLLHGWIRIRSPGSFLLAALGARGRVGLEVGGRRG